MASQDADLAGFETWLHGFAEELLRLYLRRLATATPSCAPREFNDPVWSTISLTAFEAIIVDSPLFQRLRRIRQLGVVHWIYPGATHTRFEHSLGVLHQVQQLIDSINRFALLTDATLIKKEEICFLRLAALCHDLGHGLMSHVSERALDSWPAIKYLRLDFQQDHNLPGERPPLSEIAAYYLLGAPAFAELIDWAKKLSNERIVSERVLECARKALVGQIVLPSSPLLQELISGPFDADKLDYMARDAFMSGIPAVTDIARLVRKVRAVAVNEEHLPREIQRRVESGCGPYLMIGIAFSGSRALDELLLARILLFDKVYRHQKVRALEGMVAILITKLAELYRHEPFRLLYEFSDEVLLEMNLLVRSENFALDQESAELALPIIGDLCARLRERRLFVRAHVFGAHLDASNTGTEETKWRSSVIKFLLEVGKDKSAITAEVAKKTLEILELLGKTSVTEKLADPTLVSYVWIDLPSEIAHSQKIGNAFLIKDQERLIRYRQQSPEIPNWTDAYLSMKDVGYVFCAPELKLYVFFAVEMYFRHTYGTKAPVAVFDYLKHDRKEIRNVEQQLLAKGHYRSLPIALRPLPERLTMADVPSRCQNLIDRLHEYKGPPSGEEQSTKLTKDRIKFWLSQFEDKTHIEFALLVVDSLRLIGREDVGNSMRSFLAANRDFREALVVPLGDPKDSGATAAYFARDVEGVEVAVLSKALESEKPIIFVDDFIGIGSTAVHAVECLLGIPQTRELNEADRQSLNPTQIEQLRHVSIAFIFAAGWEAGKEALSNRCKEIGLSARVHIGLSEFELPKLDNLHVGAGSEAFQKFRVKCGEIGAALVSKPESTRKPEELEQRRLGYGNRGLLITFPWNTPTQSLTCLWASGKYQELEWQPLLPRRAKR